MVGLGTLRNVKVRFVEFDSFIVISHVWSQLWSVLGYSWRQEEAWTASLWQVRMTVSSENVPIVTFGACGRSDVNRRYSICPRTLPWGTPDLIGNRAEAFPINLVRNCRLLRYDFSNWKNVGRCFFLILYNSPGCQALSKAWLTTRNTDVQYSLLFRSWRWCELYGGAAGLWSGLDETQADGGVPSRWLWNRGRFCGESVFPVFLRWLVISL